MRFLLGATALLAALTGSSAQEAWTRRRRNNKIRPNVDVEEPDPSVYGNFAEMNEKAAAGPAKRKNRRSASRDRLNAMAGNGAAGMEGMEELMKMMGNGGGMEQLMQMMGGGAGGDMNQMMEQMMAQMGDMDLGEMMSQGIAMWEQAIDSPEMQAMFNDPEQLRATMEPFLDMFGGDKAQFEALLSDPAGLQAKMKEGMAEMQALVSDPAKMEQMMSGVQEMLTDPAKLAEMQQAMLEGMDPATKAQAMAMAEQMASGDYSGLADALGGEGGGDEMAKMMELMSDPEALEAEMAKMMADPEFANSEIGQALTQMMAAQGAGGVGTEL